MANALRAGFCAAAYPLVMGATVGGARWALATGVDPAVAVSAAFAAGFALVAALERVAPYRAAWASGDRATDLAHLVLSAGLGGELGRRAALALPSLDAWPAWGLGAQLALALVVAELGTYTLHRVQHRGGLLWRLHAVHHSAPRLYALNSARNHPLDSASTTLAAFGPLVALGAGPDVLPLVAVVFGVHALLQHANADLRLGPLNRLLSLPEIHRWHHSRALGESNANYGQVLLVWDHVFGTWARPPGEPPVDVGLAPGLPGADGFPDGFAGQLKAPFEPARWRSDA